MFQFDRGLMSLSLATAALGFTNTAYADDPNAVHEASTAGGYDSGEELAESYHEDSGNQIAVAVDTGVDYYDGANDIYRYAGFQYGSGNTDHANAVAGLSGTYIAFLDPSEEYVVMYITAAHLSGSLSFVDFDLYLDDETTPLFSNSYSDSSQDLSEIHASVITGTSEVSALMYFSTDIRGGTGSYADANAILSVVQVATSSSLQNDCDIDNDGSVDALDIDALNMAILSGVTSGASSDVIATFDVDGDSDVDFDDRDELVEGSGCLNTHYGDADLDGDVDNTDYQTAISNFTGPIGLAGGKGWADGDFDGDGDVDNTDLQILNSNWGS